ncbi:MAG: pyruvate kinase [Patescibacteria group bacterium]
MKHTKIVATIGPASQEKPMMEKMIKAGMNVARLNFSHGTYKHHSMLIRNFRSVSAKLGVKTAIIQDLQGPRIRIGDLPAQGIKVGTNSEVALIIEEEYSAKKKSDFIQIPIQYPQLCRDLKAGDQILIDDATIELKVTRINNKIIYCKVVTPGIIKSHKGMNFPGSLIKCPPITKKDLQDVEFGIKSNVDFVAMSFVKEASEVVNLRKKILALEKKYHTEEKFNFDKRAKSRVHTRIIAKIERREAIENLDSILEEVDAIMVARGDLGIEMPFEELPLMQKNIIEKCRKVGKPVIVATQMLDSMIRNPLPTRAEVSDVANAVLDGTDAIMLSGESASGKYPLKAIQVMTKIAEEMEGREIAEAEKDEKKFKNSNSINQIISYIAQDLAEDVDNATLIVCATVSGYTAKNICRLRPGIPIVALTPSKKTLNQLALSWGVNGYFMPFDASFDDLLLKIKKLLVKNKLAKKGDLSVIVAGYPFSYKSQSNLIKVEMV